MARVGSETRFPRGLGWGAARSLYSAPPLLARSHFLLEASLILLCPGSHPRARDEVFHFNSPPLPLGSSMKLGEERRWGYSPLLCPSDPASLLLSSACLLFRVPLSE